METISTADESVAAGIAVSVVKDTTSYERQSSLTAMLSKSIGSIVGAVRKSSKSLSDGKKTTILMRQPYSLPDVETWTKKTHLVILKKQQNTKNETVLTYFVCIVRPLHTMHA